MANHIELRKVIVVTQPSSEQSPTHTETWEYRTKDVLVSLLGVSLGSWSGWQKIEEVTVYQDAAGNPL